MEAKFESKIENLPIITRKEYAEKLQRLIQLENDHSIKKAKSDYRLLEKFDVLELTIHWSRKCAAWEGDQSSGGRQEVINGNRSRLLQMRLHQNMQERKLQVFQKQFEVQQQMPQFKSMRQ